MKIEDYIDFHAHHPSLRGERVIQDGTDTRGRHPWRLLLNPPQGEEDISHSLNFLLRFSTQALRDYSFSHSLLAVGESGLDKVCSTPYELQLQVFREEVKLSEQLQKPLFLHCVRAIDDVLHIRRELKARQPWIWHGYRGNAQQLQQLLPHNFYFSFGFHFNEAALLACPMERLLLETDEETQVPISELYAQVAQLRQLSLEQFVAQMHQNFHSLFGKIYS